MDELTQDDERGLTAAPRPIEVLVLDVNETLSNLGPMREALASVGLSTQALEAACWPASPDFPYIRTLPTDCSESTGRVYDS